MRRQTFTMTIVPSMNCLIFFILISSTSKICDSYEVLASYKGHQSVMPEIECSTVGNGAHELMMRGKFLRTSSIPRGIEECQKLLGNDLKRIELFATGSIFIDSDFIAEGKQLEIFFASPKWHIIGMNRKIILDGVPAKPQEVAKAENGNPGGLVNLKGENGKAGLPGGHAGHFFGIGKQFIGGRNLLISANGRNGGDGQDGGDGAKGGDGRTHIESDAIVQGHRTKSCSQWTFSTLFSGDEFTVPFENGIRGGNGGNGGLPGQGGNRGNVKLIELGDSSGIRVSANPGSNGRPGTGGRGGHGGKNGCSLVMKEKCGGDRPTWDTFKHYMEILRKDCDTGYAPSGMNGMDGISSKQRQTIKQAEFVGDFPTSVNRFNNLIIRQLQNDKDGTHDSKLMGFYEQINRNESIMNSYDMLTIIHEFSSLEREYHRFEHKNQTIPFYQLFKEKILNFRANAAGENNHTAYDPMIKYLQELVSSRIDYIHHYENSQFVITNFGVSLDSYNNKKSLLMKLQTYMNELRTLQGFKKQHELRIRAAQNAVNDDLFNDLEKLNDETDQAIETLIVETTQLMKDAEKNKKDISEKQDEMRRKFYVKAAFWMLELGADALIASGEGAIFGACAKTVLSTLKPLIIDEKDPRAIALEIPRSVDEGLTFSQQVSQGCVDSWVSVLRYHRDYVEEMKKTATEAEDIGALESLILSLQKIEKDASVSPLWKNPFQTEKDMLRKEKAEKAGKPKYAKTNEVLNRLMILAEAAQIKGESWARPQSDSNVLGELDKAMRQQNKRIGKLEDYQRNVENFISPVLKKLHNLTDPNHIVFENYQDLNLFQHKMMGSLKEMKETLETLTDGLDAKEKFSIILKRVTESMRTVIAEYESMQHNIDRIGMATFIADLKIADAKEILPPFIFLNSELGYAVAELESLKLSNNLLNHYQKMVSSLDMFMFPCRGFFLNNIRFDLKDGITLKEAVTNSGEIMNEVAPKILYNIIEGDLSPTVQGKDIFDFDSAFYTWDGEKYREDIVRLLNKEYVTLNATIPRDSDFDAVKFRTINFRLIRKDDTFGRSQDDIIIDKCDFELTHSGRSYYKYDKSIYEIDSVPMTLITNWRNPIHEQDQIDFMFSPYTQWTFRIKAKKECDMQLQKIRGETLNLALVGSGSYMYSDDQICRDTVDVFYKKCG